MYLSLKIKCACGCCYEIDRQFDVDSPPVCPNCRVVMRGVNRSGIIGLFDAAKEIETWRESESSNIVSITIRTKPKSQA